MNRSSSFCHHVGWARLRCSHELRENGDKLPEISFVSSVALNLATTVDPSSVYEDRLVATIVVTFR